MRKLVERSEEDFHCIETHTRLVTL